MAGEFIVKYLKGKGKIVEIKGTEGASPTIERHEGFMSVVNKYKDIEVIYSESGIFLESIGEKKMEEALLLNPEIYNPQNEMFATFQTKRYFIQNETSSKK